MAKQGTLSKYLKGLTTFIAFFGKLTLANINLWLKIVKLAYSILIEKLCVKISRVTKVRQWFSTFFGSQHS